MNKVGKSVYFRKGFTIVELLIVIVIIGILAALVIVAYRGIQNRSTETAIRSDIGQFRKKIEMIKTDSSNDLYPDINMFTTAAGIKFTKNAYNLTRNNVYYAVSSDRKSYALGVVPAYEANAGFIYVSSTGNITSAPSVWGVDVTAAIGGTTYGSPAIFDYPGDGSGSGWASWVN